MRYCGYFEASKHKLAAAANLCLKSHRKTKNHHNMYGGDGESRTRVQRQRHFSFYERSQHIVISLAPRPANRL